MNAIDILILLAILLPAIVGAAYGFLNIVFSISAWLLAVGFAVKFGAHFAPLLEPYVGSPLARDALAYAGVFLLSLMILSAVGYAILKLLGRAGLTAADRILGFCFGFGLGGAIIGVVVFLAGFTALPGKPQWGESILLPPFVHMSMWAERFLPQDVVKHHSYSGQRDTGPAKDAAHTDRGG
ncbi:MAG: CvpA family protein [Gammaproteobacteria bacterium]|nr:CvpA family protein [Gammaproteobacteria bacterium]